MAAEPGPTPIRVHPERVRAVLDPRLTDATIARLLGCGRLRGQLDAQLGLADRPEMDATSAFARLAADPAETARRAGALLYGQAVRAVLSGPAVGELVAVIGREAHALALRNGALAPPRHHNGDLAHAILCDGQACLGAWLLGQDEGLRRMVLLSLPPGTLVEMRPDPDLCGRADAIMAQVAQSFAPAGANSETEGAHG